ncbi:hypothetical protein N0V86_005553 [Didymella sp. IMI 355093]|nr:hypothetical protein N0V86_005553 [Didymella sp. IMI 355093]
MTKFHNLNEAWRSQIRTISLPDGCPICFEAFTPSHPGVAFIGSNACTHIFGRGCLKVWLSSRTDYTLSCPTCRQSWFCLASNDNEPVSMEDVEEESDDQIGDGDEGFSEAEEKEEQQAEDYAEDDDWEMEDVSPSGTATTLDDLTNRESAAVFVSALHDELRLCENNASDPEIKACVVTAFLDADLHGSVPISDALWAKIRGMVRRMLRDAKKQEWDDRVEVNWIRRLVRALKLNLDR